MVGNVSQVEFVFYIVFVCVALSYFTCLLEWVGFHLRFSQDYWYILFSVTLIRGISHVVQLEGW